MWSLSDIKSLTSRQRDFWTQMSDYVAEQTRMRGVKN